MATVSLEDALAIHQSGDLEQAEKAYLDIVMNDPGNSEALKLLGVLACQRQNFDDGISYLEAAIQNDDSVAEYHLAMARALLSTGKVEEGVASLTRASELDPGRAEIFATLGDVLQQVQKFGEALHSYQRALVIEPSNLKLIVNSGLCAVFAGQHETAREYLELAQSEDGSIPQVHYGLAMISAEADDKPGAKAHIDEALKLDPENPEYQRLQKEFSAS